MQHGAWQAARAVLQTCCTTHHVRVIGSIQCGHPIVPALPMPTHVPLACKLCLLSGMWLLAVMWLLSHVSLPPCLCPRSAILHTVQCIQCSHPHACPHVCCHALSFVLPRALPFVLPCSYFVLPCASIMPVPMQALLQFSVSCLEMPQCSAAVSAHMY